MLRARAQAPTRAPSPSISRQRGKSRDLPVTRPSRDTVSYGPGTAPSLFSTLRTRALALARAPAPSQNPAGAITGWYSEATDVVHAYVRAANGSFTVFDAPGAGSTPASFDAMYSFGINPAGAISGSYIDDSNVCHSFVRAPDGTLTTFDAPGAGTGAFQGTVAFANNPAGAITGYYLDESNVNHGFVRAHNGTFTTFDAPGAGTGAFQGTVANSNNPAGAITGYYTDANDVIHGFLRNP